MKRQAHVWTPEEEAALRKLYADTPSVKVAEQLGLTLRQVYQGAHKFGLHKSPEFLASPDSGRLIRGSEIGLSGRFRPGLTPWNKGKKGLVTGGVETQFKPGQMPHTWKPIGSERVADGYLQRKLTDTGYPPRDWVPVHHIIWREAGGEIPPGHALIFKDGNRSNIVLENLELVSRVDLMRRNSIHNYGPEVSEVMRLRGRITRQINKNTRQERESA